MALVERQAEQVLLGEQRAQDLRELARRVDLGGARGDALGSDLPDDVAEVPLLGRQRVLALALGQLHTGGHQATVARAGVSL